MDGHECEEWEYTDIQWDLASCAQTKLSSVLCCPNVFSPQAFKPHVPSTAGVCFMASLSSTILLFEIQELLSEDLAVPCALRIGTGVPLETCSA